MYEVKIRNNFEKKEVKLTKEKITEMIYFTYHYGFNNPDQLFDDPEYEMTIREKGSKEEKSK